MGKWISGLGFPTRALLLIVAGVVFVDGLQEMAFGESTLGSLQGWLRGQAMDDSWRHMRLGYDALLAPHQQPLYQQVFIQQGIKFQYPLTSLLPFYAADHFGFRLGDARLNMASRLVVLVNALAVAQIAHDFLKSRSSLAATRVQPLAAWALAGLMALLFYPVLKAYSLGQVQSWINAWFALACLAWLRGHGALAGVLIGLVCLFKPQFALFLSWALLRRQWHFAVGWGVVVLSGAALSIALFGLRDNLDYLSALSVMSRHGEVYYPNQSFNGLVNRLLGNGDSLTWMEYALAPYHPVVHAATLIFSAALVVPALLYRRRERQFSVVDVLIAAVTFTVASPIAWEHHYGVLVPAFPVLALLLLEISDPASRRRLMGALVLAYLFCSRYWTSTQVFAFTWANVLQSYLFLAGLAVLWLLYRLRDRAASRLAPQDAAQGFGLEPRLASGPGAPVARTALMHGVDGGAQHGPVGRGRPFQR